MRQRCGIVEPGNGCRCGKRVETAVRQGRVDTDALLFVSSAEQAARYPEVVKTIRGLEETRRVATLYRLHDLPPAGEEFAGFVRELIASV